MLEKKQSIIALFSILIIFVISGFLYKNYTKTRDGLIVEVPIEAFDNNGILIDENWKRYLIERKPVGVIFFKDHFKNKEVGKKIVEEVKKAINDKVILSVDEEGGRINRFSWLDIKSAEEVASEYFKIQSKEGNKNAKEFIRQQYIPMFQEMKDLGLNMTFAPNLDLNKYSSLQEGTDEYENYKQCVKYVRLARKDDWKIKEDERQDYINSFLFLVYLDEIGKRKINLKFLDNKDKIEQAIQQWKQMDENEKQNLIKQFEPLVKYVNYVSVVGDRSFGLDLTIVSEIAGIFTDTAKDFGIKCVAKHALGHGRVDGDTHLEKQHYHSSIKDIINDIQPYISLKDKIDFIMPSHIIYDSIDDKNSAINSKKVLKFIREKVKKDVIFITDDISMDGANDEIKSPCELWIVSHKTINDIKKIGKKNRLKTSKVGKIFK